MPSTSRGYPYPSPSDITAGDAQMQALAAAIDSDVSASIPELAVTTFGDFGAFAAGATSSSTLNSANTAQVAVIKPKFSFTPTKFAWWCVTQSGNYDLAIIDMATLNRLWSLGSTAYPAAGPIVNTIAAGPTLAAGTRYGLAIASSSGTFAFQSSPALPTNGATLYDGSFGTGYVSSSFPIPATLGALSVWSRVAALALRA